MGIDLQAKAVEDSRKIHNGTLSVGGFAVDMTFTDLVAPTPNTLTIKGLFTDISLAINPETGMFMIGGKVVISFHQLDLTIWDGKADLQRWKVQFVNAFGQTVIAELDAVMPDRVFGDVQVNCKIISAEVV